MPKSTVALTPRTSRVESHVSVGDRIRMRNSDEKSKDATAVVYCEANFGAIDGKNRKWPGPALRKIQNRVGDR